MRKSFLALSILLIVASLIILVPVVPGTNYSYSLQKMPSIIPLHLEHKDFVFPLVSSKDYTGITSDILKKKIENTVLISIKFEMEGLSPRYAYGSGGFVRPGLLITARHVLLEFMSSTFENSGIPFRLDSNGIPVSDLYTYKIQGTITGPTENIYFELEPIAIGSVSGTYEDYLLLRVKDADLKRLAKDNRAGIVFGREEFAEAIPGDRIYVNGYSPLYVSYLGYMDQDAIISASTLLNIEHNKYLGVVTDVITDMPLNRLGVKKIYQIFLGSFRISQGYSGTLVWNDEGKIVGIAIIGSQNFCYIISSLDLQEFIWKSQDRIKTR